MKGKKYTTLIFENVLKLIFNKQKHGQTAHSIKICVIFL